MTSIRTASIILVLGSLLLYPLDPLLAKGFALGGLASLTGAWILYRQTKGLLINDPSDIQLRSMKGTLIRLPIYAAALYFAHRLDPVTNHALFAALAGYFAIRTVVIYFTIAQSK